MGNAHAAERVGRRRFLAMTAACGTLALLASERPAEAADAVVDARQLGARGDGSTDDTRAINAAIDRASANGGGSVVLPAGTYVVGSDDYIHLKSGVSLRGSGIDTVIVAAAGRAPHQLVAEGQPSADITIEGIVFDGRGAAVSLIRLIRPGSRGITIRNCQLRNIGPGKDHFGIVVGASVTSVTIQSNQFANQGNVQGVGISCFGGVANLTIADNTFDGLYGCVRLDAFSGGTRDVNVTGNLMRTWRKWGVLVEGSDRVDVSRNRLENCVGDASDAPFGISAQLGSKRVSISSNTLIGAGEVSSYNSSDVVIAQNTVSGATWSGIEVNDNRQITDGSDAVHVQVVGNRVEGSARSGIFVSGEDIVIQDNVVFGNGGNGITVAEGGKGIQVIGNTARANGQARVDSSGIRIGYGTDSANLRDVVVSRNVCFLADPLAGQVLGIHVEGPVQNCQVTGNVLGDDLQDAVRIDTANAVMVDANQTSSAVILATRV